MSDFFSINMPYGIARNEKNEWIAFNRNYRPLGQDTNFPSFQLTKGHEDYPVYTKYKGITEAILLELATDESAIGKDDSGKINQVWFYDLPTNPMNNEANWNAYMEKIKKVSRLRQQ